MTKRIIPVAFLLLAAVGCNVCEDLDARICEDLGPDDCAEWKATGTTFVDKARSRPRHALQERIFGPDANSCRSAGRSDLYPKMLEAVKTALQSKRDAEARQAEREAAQAERAARIKEEIEQKAAATRARVEAATNKAAERRAK